MPEGSQFFLNELKACRIAQSMFYAVGSHRFFRTTVSSRTQFQNAKIFLVFTFMLTKFHCCQQLRFNSYFLLFCEIECFYYLDKCYLLTQLGFVRHFRKKNVSKINKQLDTQSCSHINQRILGLVYKVYTRQFMIKVSFYIQKEKI